MRVLVLVLAVIIVAAGCAGPGEDGELQCAQEIEAVYKGVHRLDSALDDGDQPGIDIARDDLLWSAEALKDCMVDLANSRTGR